MPTVIDRTQAQQLIEHDEARLVEVLPRDEYDEEHLPAAIHLPLKQIDEAHAAAVLDRSRPVIVYCWDGL